MVWGHTWSYCFESILVLKELCAKLEGLYTLEDERLGCPF